MITVSAICEGDGEVAALPILLRRLSDWLTPDIRILVDNRPIRIPRTKLLKFDDQFRRHLLLAAKKCKSNGWVLILLDADDDCPAELGRKIVAEAKTIAPHISVAAVLANKEYEAWFIAGAKSLHGKREFIFNDADYIIDPEQPRNAKGWLANRRVTRHYDPIHDQPALSAGLCLELTRERSRSFRKLCTEWAAQCARLAADNPP